MIVQLMSDLHLEYMKNIESVQFSINCDILCLCGDIGNPYNDVYWDFINYCKDKCKYVLLLSGNHEIYGSSKIETEAFIRHKSSLLKNVIYLQKNVFFL